MTPDRYVVAEHEELVALGLANPYSVRQTAVVKLDPSPTIVLSCRAGEPYGTMYPTIAKALNQAYKEGQEGNPCKP